MKLQNKVRRDALSSFGYGVDKMGEFKVCSSCRSLESSSYSRCSCCKTPLPDKTLFDLYKTQHKLCSQCETVITDGMRYCPHCGRKVDRMEKTG